ATPLKRSGDEEERSPLLDRDSQSGNNPESSQVPTGDHSYGSIQPGQPKSKSANSEVSGNLNSSSIDSDGKATNQSTTDYIKSFKIRLPGPNWTYFYISKLFPCIILESNLALSI